MDRQRRSSEGMRVAGTGSAEGVKKVIPEGKSPPCRFKSSFIETVLIRNGNFLTVNGLV